MDKFTFVTGQHGNEPIPVFALSSKNIPQVIANPRALALGKRFLDCDLNSSFNAKSNKYYEHRRAKELLDVISPKTIIIDLHTFSADSEPFVVIVDKKMVKLARQTGLKHIVLMEHNIKNDCALINHRNGISVEVGKHNDYKSFLMTLKIIDNINSGEKKNKEAIIYSVFDIIRKPGDYVNFKKNKDGFVPILAGEKAYDFYGLKAKRIKL